MFQLGNFYTELGSVQKQKICTENITQICSNHKHKVFWGLLLLIQKRIEDGVILCEKVE